GETADSHLQALEVVDGVDLLAEPTAHLAAGVAGEQRNRVVLFVELVEHLLAAADREPALVQARVRSERDRSAEREGRVLAEVVVRGGVADLDAAVLHSIDELQSVVDVA